MLATACLPTDLGVDHRDPEPTCAKEHCDFDAAYIGGNLDLPDSVPVRLEVEVCVDGDCDPAATFRLEPAQFAARGSISVRSGAICAGPPFICTEMQKWWVSWQPSIASRDGGLVGSYRIVIRDLDTGQTLEDHTFDDPTYETVAARDCKAGRSSDGEVERVTCTHFSATWD